jgi:ergothioneine biosynthesis protein EgtB
MQTGIEPAADVPAQALRQRLFDCRARTLQLIDGLSDADVTVQSMDDASPAKWHLAHTTWFFEEFVLGPFVSGYRPADPRYRFLFNSYYEAVGPRHARPRRGLLTRPSIEEVVAYRRHIDDALSTLLVRESPRPALELVELGIQHEQQHQELLLTDLLHLFAQNPLRPVYRAASAEEAVAPPAAEPATWIDYDGGVVEVGHDGPGFAFDCETPRHRVALAPYALASCPVTIGEWCEFIADGGYREPRLWLADGWARVQAEGWQAPLYWDRRDGAWLQMTLSGERALDVQAPVSNVSYFEADAFARWRGARLPTEHEWEVAARAQPIAGNFASTGRYRPRAASHDAQAPLRQLYGDVWEWTASAFAPYPGFRVAEGAVGEYNGKFMCGQYVLRGGSCATPDGHLRATYRNFFYPHQRWQFSGVRLARDR